MINFRATRWLAAAAGVVVAVTMIGGFFVLSAGGSTDDIELDGVDKSNLNAAGYKLLQPDAESEIDRSTAESVASDKFRGAVAKETVLARLVNDISIPRLDNLAWAVNFDPSSVRVGKWGGPADPSGPKPALCGPPVHHVAFIDAMTGEFLFASQRTSDKLLEQCPPREDDGATPTAAP